MARSTTIASRDSSRSPRASAELPVRRCSCTTASAAGTLRSSSIAATNSAGSSAPATSASSATPDLLGGTLDEPREPVPGGLGLAQGVVGPLEHRAVLHGRHRVAQDGRALLGQHDGDQQPVAERLAHLGAALRDPAVVQPVLREPVAGGPRLGLLVLVVREAQVEPAAVDVEGLAEVPLRHRRALEVPARPAAAERGVPGGRLRLAGLGGLPQREVAGVALGVVVDRAVGRGDHVVDPLVGQRAVLAGSCARRTTRRRGRSCTRGRSRRGGPSARSSRGRGRSRAARSWAAARRGRRRRR